MQLILWEGPPCPTALLNHPQDNIRAQGKCYRTFGSPIWTAQESLSNDYLFFLLDSKEFGGLLVPVEHSILALGWRFPPCWTFWSRTTSHHACNGRERLYRKDLVTILWQIQNRQFYFFLHQKSPSRWTVLLSFPVFFMPLGLVLSYSLNTFL
jgi:hypothetical protein